MMGERLASDAAITNVLLDVIDDLNVAGQCHAAASGVAPHQRGEAIAEYLVSHHGPAIAALLVKRANMRLVAVMCEPL